MEQTLKRVEILVTRIEERQRAHDRELFGNGKKGLIVRVDSLEGSRREWIGRASVISAIVALLIALAVGVAVNMANNRDELRLLHQPAIETPAR